MTVSLSNVATSVAFTEAGSAVTLSPSLAVSDSDSTTLASATVQITGGSFGGDGDTLIFSTAGTSITANYDSTSETLTLTGSDTLANYSQVLDSVTFNNTSQNPADYGSDPVRTVIWTVNDGSAGTTAASTIDITAVNNPPTLALGTTTASWTQQQAQPTTLAPSVTVTDPDDLDLVGATVAIIGGGFAGDTLAATTTGTSITAHYNPANETLTLTGTDTLLDYQHVLDTVTFKSTNLNPTDYGSHPNRTLTWLLNDGHASSHLSSAVTESVSITAVDQPPNLGVAASAVSSQGAMVTLSSVVGISDPDNLDLASATVSITGGTFAGDGDVLGVNGVTNGFFIVEETGGTITFAYASATEQLTFTGSDTLAHYQQALEAVTFASTAASPNNHGANPTRTVTWVVNDGQDSSTQRTETVTIDSPPTLSGVLTTSSWTEEQASPTTLSPNVTISDPDGVNTQLSATVSIVGGVFTGDGDTLAIGGATSGTVGAISFFYNSSSETLTLTGSDSLANYQTALDSVIFNAGENPTDFGSNPSRNLTWTVADHLGSESAPVTTAINITNVNDPPTLGNVASIAFYTEHGIAMPLSGAVSVTDPDNLTLAGATVQINGGTFAGDADTFAFNVPGPGVTFSYNSATETLTFTGTDTLAHYQSVLDSVAFLAGENPTDFGSHPTRTVVWTLNDGGASNNLSAPVTEIVSITNVNDPPALSGVATSVQVAGVGQTVTVSPSVTVSDPDNLTLAAATVQITGGTFSGDGDQLSATGNGTIAVSYNPTTETLTLTGTDTLAHYQQVLDSVTFDLTSANPTNFGANPTRTLAWVLNDGSGSNNLSTAVTTTISIGGVPRNDFNDDGKSDLLWQNNDGTPAIWEMNGTALIGGGVIPNPGGAWHVEASADFNHDGKADVILQNSDGTPEIWLMNGASVTSTVTLPNPGSSWHVVAAADFLGTGNPDILWQNTDGAAAIWEMNGTTLIGGGALSINPGPSWHLIGAADVNGDGKADLLWQNNDGTPAIWEMNGTSIIGGGLLLNPGTSWHAIGLGDFNGDGNADILWQNTDGAAAIWELNGTSIIGGGVLSPNLGSSWHAIGTSDFNGDGKADILWQNADGAPQIWEMNGTNIIGSSTLINPGSAWQLKDDGPISPDPTQTGLQPPALHLSTPDGSAPQAAPPSAPTWFTNSDPNLGQPTWLQLHPGTS